jgi:hypothetical protein
MTATNDAIAAFLAKGGKVRKVSAGASNGMTAGQWQRAIRDPEPEVKVIGSVEYPGASYVATLKTLVEGIEWQHPNETACNRRLIGNAILKLSDNLKADKAHWLDTNKSYAKEYTVNALEEISRYFDNVSVMSDAAYFCFNHLYKEVSGSKLDLI